MKPRARGGVFRVKHIVMIEADVDPHVRYATIDMDNNILRVHSNIPRQVLQFAALLLTGYEIADAPHVAWYSYADAEDLMQDLERGRVSVPLTPRVGKFFPMWPILAPFTVLAWASITCVVIKLLHALALI